MKHLHRIVKTGVIVATIAVLAACATTAEDAADPTVSIEPTGPSHISPAASPGEQDSVQLRLTAATHPGVELQRVSIGVQDSAGTQVYRQEWSDRMSADEVPALIRWAGTNDRVQFVPDGSYTLRVTVVDSVGQQARSNAETILVDNTVPQVSIRTPYTVFSPDGDGNRDVIELEHQVEDVDMQHAELLDADGTVLRNWQFESGEGTSVTWNGRDADGERVEDGRYRYVYTAGDAAGNTARASIEDIRVDTDSFSAALERAVPAFSPDGDGVRDAAAYRVALDQRDRISQWTLSVSDADGNQVAERSSSTPPAERITFDGRADGSVLDQGSYVATFRGTYANGDLVTASARPVRLDLQAPEPGVTATADRFSPNSSTGQITIEHSGSDGAFWEGEIIEADGEEALLSVSWDDELPQQFTWNGQTDSGKAASGGSYVYRLTGRDTAGNEASATTSAFILDRAGPDVSASVQPQPFTPDGDGTNDELTIEISSSDRSGIASWSLEILGPTGNPFHTRSGEGAPPETLSWDGAGDDGSLVQSARDYTAAVSLTDEAGNTSTTERSVPVGILVSDGSGGDLQIRLSSIVFAPFEDDYRDLRDPAREERNQQTIDRIASILSEYPGRDVRIEGHAVHLYTDEDRREIEQRETLLPLSRNRAAAIREALADRGIDAERLSVTGRGGSEPLVPHTNREDRWRNRRVEFELIEG